MVQKSSHRILVCTSCRQKGHEHRPGIELIQKLESALSSAPNAAAQDFEVAGVACMAGCTRPCTVAFQASHKATYLFGDITPDEDIEDLVNFAHHYRLLHDGWCSSVDRPGKLRKSTLARVPASMTGSLETLQERA